MEAMLESEPAHSPDNIELEPRQSSRRQRKGKVTVGRTTCKVCRKSLNYNSLTPHMKKYHPIKSDVPYSCEKYGCSEQFVTLAERHRHNLAIHDHEPEQLDRSVSDALKMPVYRLYKPAYFSVRVTRYCHLCGKRCADRTAYRRHRNVHFPQLVSGPPSNNPKASSNDSGHSVAKRMDSRKETELEYVNRQCRRAMMAAEGIMEYPGAPSTSNDRRSVSPVIASRLEQLWKPRLKKRRGPPIFEPDDPLMMYVLSDDDDENSW